MVSADLYVFFKAAFCVFLAAKITKETARVLQLLTKKIEFSTDIISEAVRHEQI